MSTSGGVPLWVPLVVALVGLSGVLYTQWRSDKRDERTRREAREREAEQWERQREERREQWAREDGFRSWTEKRDAYITYVRQWEAVYDSLSNRLYLPAHYPSPDGPIDDTFAPVFTALSDLKVFGSAAASEAANHANVALLRLNEYAPVQDVEADNSDLEQADTEARARFRELRAIVREELGVEWDPLDKP